MMVTGNGANKELSADYGDATETYYVQSCLKKSFAPKRDHEVSTTQFIINAIVRPPRLAGRGAHE